MAHDVFISYSSKDKPIADTIVAALENNQIRCWYAPRDIKPAEDWGNAITDAVTNARVFLMIFSGNANQSQRVLDELNFAISQQAVILPFRIENLEPKGAMKLHLASRHWLDAYDPSWHSHIKKLVKTVSDNLDNRIEDQQIVLPASIEKKVAQEQNKLARIIAGVVIGALVITVGWFGYISLFPQDEKNSSSMALEPTSTSTPITPEPTLELTTEPTIQPTPTLYDYTLELGPPDYETDFLTYGINNGEWPQGLEKEGRSVNIGDDGTLIVDNLSAAYYKKSTKSRMVVDAKFLYITGPAEPAIVLFCLDNPQGNYTARFFLSGEVTVVRDDGKRLITGKVPPFEIGKFYRLRFDCEGGGLYVFVNGSDNKFAGGDGAYFSGYPGLSAEGAIVVFDNFKLWLP